MRKRKPWKTAAKYAAGMLILTISVTLSMYFPQWYGTWQDSQLLGKVQLSGRASIEFIDTASLDSAGRMQLISQAKEVYWEDYENYPSRVLQDPYGYLDICREQVKNFIRCGLVPEMYLDLVTDEYCEIICSPFVIIDQNRMLQVNVLSFNSWDSNRMIMVIDSELDIVYYLSFSGESAADEILRRFGYDSWERLENDTEFGAEITVNPEISSEWNLAAVCGAESAEVVRRDFMGEMEFQLDYENFTAPGYHYLIASDDGPGFVLMFGNSFWIDLARDVFAQQGYVNDGIIINAESLGLESEEAGKMETSDQ